MKTVSMIRSEICSLRNKLEELVSDAREIVDDTDSLESEKAEALMDSLMYIATDLAELEND